MRETFRILPVYTGDVSGVCAALYELGGMIVIHDPSGCNSTYNTHDEIRWYDQESLIFLSGLKERDAILGNDQRLIEDTVEAARAFHPAFIALCNSPIPFLNGTDFHAVCRRISDLTALPVFYIPTNAMHDYTVGGGEALVRYAETVLWPSAGGQPAVSGQKVRVNILGVTPLDFAADHAAGKLTTNLEEHDIEVLTCWTMGERAQHLELAKDAHVNVVVSAMGLPLAQYMRERFAIPYVVGIPTQILAGSLAQLVMASARDRKNRMITDTLRKEDWFCTAAAGEQRPGEAAVEILLIGEPVVCLSLAAELELSGVPEEWCREDLCGEYAVLCVQKKNKKCLTKILCTVENGKELLRRDRGDCAVWGEEETSGAVSAFCHEALKNGRKPVVIADPLYRPIIPENARWIEVPHLAFSGRIYLHRMPDLSEGIKALTACRKKGGD